MFHIFYAARKEGQLTLGWDVDQHLNEFQIKKQQKDYGITGKVGCNAVRNFGFGKESQQLNLE